MALEHQWWGWIASFFGVWWNVAESTQSDNPSSSHPSSGPAHARTLPLKAKGAAKPKVSPSDGRHSSSASSSSQGPGTVNIVDLTHIESEDESPDEPVQVFYVPDLRLVRQLAETASSVRERVFDLPESIPGVCLLNELAFSGLEGSGPQDFDLLAEGLKPCVAFDIFKTLVFPQRLADRSQEQICLARHRGELQVIHRKTAELLQNLSFRGFNFCAISFIGKNNHQDYCRALSEASLLSLIPILFIVFDRESKAKLARRLDCIVAFDDQQQLITSYQRKGVRAVQVTRDFGLHTHSDEALTYISQLWEEHLQARPVSSSIGLKSALRLTRH